MSIARSGLSALALFAALAVPAMAGDTILTIKGMDASKMPATFAIEDLEAMEKTVIQTSTPWFDGVTTFEGVRLDTLMETVGASGQKLSVVALNDYISEIPFSDLSEYGPIVAYKRDGEYMKIEDKGPLFVIYPYDSHPDLSTEQFFARSVWQVAEFEIQ